MEHHVGKLTEVLPAENESYNKLAERLLSENNKKLESFYKNVFEQLNDDMCGTYHYYKGKIYKIEDKEFEDESDIVEGELNIDNTIDYQIRYYNGGAGFTEMLEAAINKAILNKK